MLLDHPALIYLRCWVELRLAEPCGMTSVERPPRR